MLVSRRSDRARALRRTAGRHRRRAARLRGRRPRLASAGGARADRASGRPRAPAHRPLGDGGQSPGAARVAGVRGSRSSVASIAPLTEEPAPRRGRPRLRRHAHERRDRHRAPSPGREAAGLLRQPVAGEELAAELRRAEVPTFVSHSSLSLDERRQAEEAFAEGSDCVIVATSTLELGIDVGDLDRVIQIDAPGPSPPSCSASGGPGAGQRRAGTVSSSRPRRMLCFEPPA